MKFLQNIVENRQWTQPIQIVALAKQHGIISMYGKLAHLYPIGSAAARRSAFKRYLVHLLYLLASFSAIISRTLLRTMLLVIHKSSTLEANNSLFLPLLTIPHLMSSETRAQICKPFKKPRNLTHRPVRLHSMVESIPWNWLLGIVDRALRREF